MHWSSCLMSALRRVFRPSPQVPLSGNILTRLLSDLLPKAGPDTEDQKLAFDFGRKIPQEKLNSSQIAGKYLGLCGALFLQAKKLRGPELIEAPDLRECELSSNCRQLLLNQLSFSLPTRQFEWPKIFQCAICRRILRVDWISNQSISKTFKWLPQSQQAPLAHPTHSL